MTFRVYTDKGSFSNHIIDYLLEQEAINNILLSMIDDPERQSTNSAGQSEYFAGVVDVDTEPHFVCARRPTFHLIVYGDNDPEIVHCAVDGILINQPDQEGIIGPRAVTDAFAERYAQVSGKKVDLEMEQLIYELTRVSDVKTAPGSLRVAGSSDTPLLIQWSEGFQRDTGSRRATSDVRDRVLGMVARKSAFLWEHDNRTVSLAVHSRSTRNCAAISGVYTPDEYRGHGYATACVAAVSARLIDAGYSHCCLYTDASFPTSNRIYKRIGYRVIGSSIVYRFSDRTKTRIPSE